MRTKAFTHLQGAVERGGVFNVGSKQSERKIPDGIKSFLQQHGIDVTAMFKAGQKFSAQQIDSHFATRNTKISDKMAVKSCLAQLNLIY